MNTKKRKKLIWTLPKKTFCFFLLCIFYLYAHLLYLSISPNIYGKNMKEFASTRNTVRKTIEASRGSIYDTNLNALALNVTSYTLIAYLDEKRSDNNNLNHVADIDDTADKLASVLDADSDKIKSILENGKEKNRYQVEFGSIGSGITELKKDEIESLNLPGISFIESSKRYYPNGNFASYVVGYARKKEEEVNGEVTTSIVGELGIEAAYDDMLNGTNGYLEYQQDRYGYKISGTKEINEPATDGYDIYLTIDSSIQRFIETEIEDIQSTYDPEWTVLTVMDAQTGEILGASSTPSFDPNVRDIVSYENPFSVTSYEPGSTMKIYTYLCALETGNYDGNKTFNSGSIKIGDDKVRDWNNTGWGTITLDKGFEYSSNVGVVNLIQSYLSREQLKECFKKYGFGAKTGVEFSKESAGKINFNYEVEVATAGFGQGIETTVLQQLQGATIISTGGYLVKPHFVKKIVNPNTDEVVYESSIEKSEQLVKKSSVEKIKELMYNTIHGTDSGTAGKAYNIEGFDLIGKTGTAQIYENGKGYLTGDNNYIFSSVIMYPKENPEIIIYGAMKKPDYGKYKGLSTAVKNLVKNIAKYKNIYEDDDSLSSVKSVSMSSFIGKDKETIKKYLENYDIDVIVLGSGDSIVNQYPSSGSRLLEKDRVFLFTNSKDVSMIDITNFSRNEVDRFASLVGIKVKFNGNGYVTDFNISVDDTLTKDSVLEVTLGSRED